MVFDILLLILGAILILWGADKLTDAAGAMAHRMNVSDMVIGLTVVAMGSSLPEFSVSLFSSIQGSGGMSAGNIVGSNLFNTLMIVGAVAMVNPLAVNKNNIWRDVPFTIIASCALFLLSKDMLLTGANADTLSRTDGAIFLLFFVIFMAYTFALAKNKPETNDEVNVKKMSTPSIAIWIVIGLACLIGGGQLLVLSGTNIARELGISETVIGLTILAGGTSLPEFVASFIAARKGMNGMAIGNVVGSCLFNIFFVLGVCSMVRPMNVADIDIVQFAVLIFSGLLMWIFCKTKLRMDRWEGFIMVACYISFIIYLIMK